MKKNVIFLLFVLVASGLFAEKLHRNEIYRNIDLSRELYFYEVFNENNELMFYELETVQDFSNSSTFYIRSLDKKTLLKFLNDLKRCSDRDYKKYITEYEKNNNNLSFLWDDYKIIGNSINEYFCYELK